MASLECFQTDFSHKQGKASLCLQSVVNINSRHHTVLKLGSH